MKILYIDLKLVGKHWAELCYVWDNQNQQSRQFPLAQIAGLIDRAERDYYTRLPEEYTKTGQAFYNWLDGSDRLLLKDATLEQLQKLLEQEKSSEKWV